MPENTPIRVVLVEDHVLLRGALARTLTQEPDFQIVGECSGVEETVRLVASQPVDIVLLDINLGTEQGGAFLRHAKTAGYTGKALVVTAGVSPREAAWLLSQGYSGIFLKNDPLPNLVQQIRDIVGGVAESNPELARADRSKREIGDTPRKTLTPRESEVLRGVCEGLTNKEIAGRLGISENTIKSFIQQLFVKTGVRSRAQLVAAAIEHYWDQLDGPC
jgi:DNA-binding NarL/FixJ family response regulator